MEEKKATSVEEEVSPLDPIHDAVDRYTDELGDKAQAALFMMSDQLPGPMREAAKEKILEVREEMEEVKNSFLKEMKETAKSLLDSLFGDFVMFWSVIKTLGAWYLRPASLDTKTVALENKVLAKEGKKPNRLTDIGLLKTLFLLSLAYLVLEDATTQEPMDKWITQTVFFLFYVAFLFIFVAAVWGWRKLARLPKKDTRVFVGYVLYQYSAMYLISFVVCGPLGIDALAPEANDLLIVAVYILPVFHSTYFLWRLMQQYGLNRRRKIIGAVSGFVFMAFLLIVPLVATHSFMVPLQAGEPVQGAL